MVEHRGLGEAGRVGDALQRSLREPVFGDDVDRHPDDLRTPRLLHERQGFPGFHAPNLAFYRVVSKLTAW
ncbi:hypothetical protein GCM10009539_45740 [Cryptosporangium japonicum]|uniref:Uncharacterized protein n=1 Tax=Cryptosporangium japonicum TaxID=80872 RepID=A0ABP3EB39_9ACTN